MYCENLVLNWEKCHFMVTEGIVLGHKISAKGTEKLPPPVNVKGVRSFLGHAGFTGDLLKIFQNFQNPYVTC